jgi:glucose-1-phosphate adenylyltransferase
MDYNQIINSHLEHDADITIGAFQAKEDPSRFGIFETARDCKVIGFEEKPDHPKSSLASMGIYVFKTQVLKNILQDADRLIDFGKDVIPYALEQGLNLYIDRFKGYFKDVGTVHSLFDANMDLIDNPQFLKLHEYKEFPIYTKSSNLPPHHITSQARVTNSLISDGCLVQGNLDHVVLSSGCFVEQDAQLKQVIAYENARILQGAVIENAIILKDTTIPENAHLIFEDIQVIGPDYLMKWGNQNE